MSNRNFNRKQSLEREIKDIYLETQYSALIESSATLNLTDDIVLTKVAGGAANNAAAFTTQVAAAAANPTNTVLAAFTGAANAIVCTVTPNNGTNNPTTAATATLATTNAIILTDNPNTGVLRNTKTFTTEVLAAAANPTSTVLADFTGTAAAIVCTVTPNDGSNNPTVAADATMVMAVNVYVTKVALGSTHNGDTFTTQVAAAAANPTNTILAVYSGTANNTVLTITPNDGTNNTATPVDMTISELVEFINTGAVVGKTVTVTDPGNLKALLTATSAASAVVLADGGEGDGIVGTFANGVNSAVSLTTAELRELISSGSVVGKTVTLTDTLSLRALQTATGGGAASLANSGEGDHVIATFANGANSAVSLTTAELRELINSGTVSGKTVTVTDINSRRNDQTATGGGATPLVDAGEGDAVVATFSGGQDQAFSNQIKWGVSSIAQTGTGAFRITMEDKYNAVKFVDAIVKATAAQNIVVQVKADDINGAIPYIDVISHANGVAANPSDGAVLKFVIEVKNTDII
jgi:uncharacterized spore protein YtfJ